MFIRPKSYSFFQIDGYLNPFVSCISRMGSEVETMQLQLSATSKAYTQEVGADVKENILFKYWSPKKMKD